MVRAGWVGGEGGAGADTAAGRPWGERASQQRKDGHALCAGINSNSVGKHQCEKPHPRQVCCTRTAMKKIMLGTPVNHELMPTPPQQVLHMVVMRGTRLPREP